MKTCNGHLTFSIVQRNLENYLLTQKFRYLEVQQNAIALFWSPLGFSHTPLLFVPLSLITGLLKNEFRTFCRDLSIISGVSHVSLRRLCIKLCINNPSACETFARILHFGSLQSGVSCDRLSSQSLVSIHYFYNHYSIKMINASKLGGNADTRVSKSLNKYKSNKIDFSLNNALMLRNALKQNDACYCP